MIKICAVCGTEFEAKRNDKKYCSVACRDHSYHVRKKIAGGGVPVKHSGTYRPQACYKYCLYNNLGRCKYKVDKGLARPIERWQRCEYFEDREIYERPHAVDPVEYDVMYGHIAAFKDSHSAVWMY